MRRNQRGMALLLTLVASALLSALVLQLAGSVNDEMVGSAGFRDQVRLTAMALAGFHLARAVLDRDGREGGADTLLDDWAAEDLGGLSALYRPDRVTVRVEDLSGRLQVNALVSTQRDPRRRREEEARQRRLWLALLGSGRLRLDDPETQPEVIVDSIQDWIDADDRTRDHGAESDWYLEQGRSAACANRPFTSPQELLLVRGVTPELFYGDEEHVGLVSLITVCAGDGRVNLNTAPPAVLSALAGSADEEVVRAMDEFRREEDNAALLAAVDWYRRVDGVPGDVRVDPAVATTVSTLFRVVVVAAYNEMEARVEAVLERRAGRPAVLVWWGNR